MFTLYIDILNTDNNAVTVANETDKPIIVTRRTRLGTLLELEQDEYYYIADEAADTIKDTISKAPKTLYKASWIGKIFTVLLATITSIGKIIVLITSFTAPSSPISIAVIPLETELLNSTIQYSISISPTIGAFRNDINDYSNVFKD